MAGLDPLTIVDMIVSLCNAVVTVAEWRRLRRARLTPMRVATLNLCGLPSFLSRLAPFPVRAAEIGRLIEESDVDVFNVQELWGQRAAHTLQRHLPSFRYSARKGGGLATFSRHPLGEGRYRSFAGTAPKTSTPAFRLWRAINARRQGILLTSLLDTGVTIANVHLTANKDGHWTEANRYFRFHRDQLDVVHEYVPAGKTILTGDFNIASASPLYPYITDGGRWHDPFADSDLVTYRKEFLPPRATVYRIDYVLTHGLSAHDPAPMFADKTAGMWLSDHIGLSARVGTRAAERPASA